MDLFSQPGDSLNNLLPRDGVVHYYGALMSVSEADQYLKALLDKVEWKNDEAVVFGKRIATKRKVAWYGDQSFEYTYSKTTKRALPWIEELRHLKDMIEEHSKESFNSCLLNLYHDGSEGMGWHSDGEKDLKRDGAIGSLSFGAERKFSFKHKNSGEKLSIELEHGSLLIMTGVTQTYWLHSLPPTKKVSQPRVNLTFRTIVDR